MNQNSTASSKLPPTLIALITSWLVGTMVVAVFLFIMNLWPATWVMDFQLAYFGSYGMKITIIFTFIIVTVIFFPLMIIITLLLKWIFPNKFRITAPKV